MVDKSINRFLRTPYEDLEFGPRGEGHLVEAVAK
jgi:hypothetical protein